MRCSAGKSSAGSVFLCALLHSFRLSDSLLISLFTSPASDQRGEICGGSGGTGGRNWNASCWIILENRRPGLFFSCFFLCLTLLISFFTSPGWRNLRRQRQRRGGRGAYWNASCWKKIIGLACFFVCALLRSFFLSHFLTVSFFISPAWRNQ